MTATNEAALIGTVGWRLCAIAGGDNPMLSLPPDGETQAAPVRLPDLPPAFLYLYATLESEMTGDRFPAEDDHRSAGEAAPTRALGYVLGVTSAVHGEGVSTVAVNLARAAAAATFDRVLVVEISLGEPVLAGRLGAEPSPLEGAGVVSLIEDAGADVPLLRLDADAAVFLLPAGRAPRNAARCARSPRARAVLSALRAAFDLVILELPPVVTDDANPLAQHTDGVAFVARAGVTPRAAVNAAINRVGRERVRGVVMNDTETRVPENLRRRLLAGT